MVPELRCLDTDDHRPSRTSHTTNTTEGTQYVQRREETGICTTRRLRTLSGETVGRTVEVSARGHRRVKERRTKDRATPKARTSRRLFDPLGASDAGWIDVL